MYGVRKLQLSLRVTVYVFVNTAELPCGQMKELRSNTPLIASKQTISLGYSSFHKPCYSKPELQLVNRFDSRSDRLLSEEHN